MFEKLIKCAIRVPERKQIFTANGIISAFYNRKHVLNRFFVGYSHFAEIRLRYSNRAVRKG